MKKSFLILTCLGLMLSGIVVFNACGDGSLQDEEIKGSISFWTDFNTGKPIKVDLKGKGVERSGNLTKYVTSSGTPSCGTSSTLTFSDVPFGKYSYTASVDDITWWSGEITFEHSCFTMKLEEGDFEKTGSISFWMGEDPEFIPTVELEGNGYDLSGTINMFFPSGTPNCGENGTLTFSKLPFGKYNCTLSAVGFPEITEKFTITLNKSCLTVKLDDL